MKNMSGILKSLLQAGLYLVDQPERATRNVRDRVRDGISDASDRLSDVGDRLRDARDGLTGQDNTLRYVLTFAAGIGLGVGVGILLAPDTGEETRRNVSNKFNEVGDRIKSRSKDALDYQTGT